MAASLAERPLRAEQWTAIIFRSLSITSLCLDPPSPNPQRRVKGDHDYAYAGLLATAHATTQHVRGLETTEPEAFSGSEPGINNRS